jgi:dTDP-4-dehydrorhamnose 3,5-epimerase and related enzymes
MKEKINRLQINTTDLKGVLQINHDPFEDARGSFSRVFSLEDLDSFLPRTQISQVNISQNPLKGTIRGMHFQTETAPDTKIIRCLSGSILDVVIDVRPESETFLQSQTFHLNSINKNGLLVPHGFAHGFQTLQTDTSILYLHTSQYVASSQRTLNPFDPIFDLTWPIDDPTISEKDMTANFLTDEDIFDGLQKLR